MKKGITLISLVITIILILILAGVGIAGSLALIEEAKYTAFINEMKQLSEAVQILILEKQLQAAGTDEKIELFESKLMIENIDDKLPLGVRKEVEYVRDLLAGYIDEEDKGTTLPSSYDGNIETSTKEGERIYYVDEATSGKVNAYIYDEQSASVYKIEPTIIWGVEMHGYEYGNLLVTQPGLLEKAKEEADIETPSEEETPEQPQEPEEPKIPTVADYMEEAVTQNTYTQDKYGNKIVIPANFRIVAHDEDYVVYDYDIENGVSTNIPVVQDGIVIENEDDGNQFVWVPVGVIKNDAVEDTTNTTEIQLGRYATYIMNTTTTIPTPPEPTQLAKNWSTHVAIHSHDGAWQMREYDQNSSYTNTKAYNLQTWLETTQSNGGYYIARYEASYSDGTKPLSQPSKGTPLDSSKTTTTTQIRTTGQLWNWITQPDAATASQAMYPNQTVTNAEYYSDLVNSYAWDTAIIFIQTYSGDTTYASKKSVYTDTSSPKQPANTGERGDVVEVAGSENTTDKTCNIYDMASNEMEWSTETSNYSGYPCTYRGSVFVDDTYYTSLRGPHNITIRAVNVGFRPLLYIKAE